MRVESLTPEQTQEFADSLESRYPVQLCLHRLTRTPGIRVSSIRVDEGRRNEGVGSQVMQEIVDWADALGATLVLTPQSEGRPSKTKLRAWYRSFDFVPNKGRNKDYLYMDAMIRRPQPPQVAPGSAPIPAWTDRVLAEHWDELEACVGESSMPAVPMLALGSGSYGTVFKAARPRTVIKVTSDPDEIAFAAAAMSLDVWPTGIVRYYQVVRLPETHYRREVAVLVREEAVRTGQLLIQRDEERADSGANDRYFKRQRAEFARHLAAWNAIANQVRRTKHAWDAKARRDPARYSPDMFREATARYRWRDYNERGIALAERAMATTRDDWRPPVPAYLLRSPERVGVYLAALEQLGGLMAGTYGSVEVGEALNFYLEQGVVLADVHHANIGQVDGREEYDGEVTVITDPGHAVFLDGRFDAIRWEVLDAGGLLCVPGTTQAA